MNTVRVRAALTPGFFFFLFSFPSADNPSPLPHSHHKPGEVTQVAVGTPSGTDAEGSCLDLNAPSGSARSPVWPTHQISHSGMSTPTAGLAAAHTRSGRCLTHGQNESPSKVGQPISQPASHSHEGPLTLSHLRKNGIESRPLFLQRGCMWKHLGSPEMQHLGSIFSILEILI